MLSNLDRAVLGIHSPLPTISSKWDHRYQRAKTAGETNVVMPIHCFNKGPWKVAAPQKERIIFQPSFFGAICSKKLKTQVSQTAVFQHDGQENTDKL